MLKQMFKCDIGLHDDDQDWVDVYPILGGGHHREATCKHCKEEIDQVGVENVKVGIFTVAFLAGLAVLMSWLCFK